MAVGNGKQTRRKGRLAVLKTTRKAEAALDGVQQADPEGTAKTYGRQVQTSYQSDMAGWLRRRGRRVMPRFNACVVATLRWRRCHQARAARTARREECRRSHFGAGEIAVPTWLIIVAAVFFIDLIIGRSLMGLVLRYETEGWVLLGAVAMAAFVFTIGHLGGGAIRRWIAGRGPGPDPEGGRRLRWAGVTLGIYLAILTIIVAAARVGLARWALGLAPVVGGAAIQSAKPSREAFSYWADLGMSPWSGFREWRAERVALRRWKRFHRVWQKVAMGWLQRGLQAEAIGIRWQLDSLAQNGPVPGWWGAGRDDVQGAILGQLARLGVVPPAEEVAYLREQLGGLVPDPSLNGTGQLHLPFHQSEVN